MVAMDTRQEVPALGHEATDPGKIRFVLAQTGADLTRGVKVYYGIDNGLRPEIAFTSRMTSSAWKRRDGGQCSKVGRRCQQGIRADVPAGCRSLRQDTSLAQFPVFGPSGGVRARVSVRDALDVAGASYFLRRQKGKAGKRQSNARKALNRK